MDSSNPQPRRHQWVKHIVIPVDVVADPFDDANFFATHTEEKQQYAEEAAVFGCNACSDPLNAATVNTECKGSDLHENNAT